jgi:uncharacterized protein YjbI with pentapeptide repeats
LIFILVGHSLADGQREINISQMLLEMKSNHPIKYDNVKIYDSNSSLLEGINVRSAVEITNSTIDAELELKQINFSGPIKFHGTTFNKALSIDDTIINQDADFSNTTFGDAFLLYNTSFPGKEADFANSSFQLVSFTKIKFLGAALFRNSSFISASFNQALFSDRGVDFSNSVFSEMNMENAIFEGDTSFRDVQFPGYFQFKDVQFYEMPFFERTNFSINDPYHMIYFDKIDFKNGCCFKEAVFDSVGFTQVKSSGLISSFDNTHFNGDLQFTGLLIDSIASFKDAWFGGIVALDNTEFNKKAEFNRANFLGDVSFEGAQFDDNLNLRKSNFSENINFDNAIISGDIYCEDINFTKRLSNKVQTGHMSLNGTGYNRIFVNWKDIDEGFLLFDGNAYLLLIDNFKKLGRVNDANDCYYEYKRSNSRNLEGLYSIADAYYWVLCGYGVRPEWALYWALFFIVSFGFYFMKNDGMNLISAFVFSITIFISGTGKLFVDKPEYSPERNPKVSMFLFTFERIMGGVLIVLFLISLRRWVTI